MRKVIIDTDAGVDDAQAIQMLLKAEHGNKPITILAILTSYGNTCVQNSTRNVKRLLELVNRSDIPIYSGCNESLLGVPSTSTYYGKDGFGDVLDDKDDGTPETQSEHATSTLVRLVNEYPGEIELLCLGPLTNLATALKLDPNLGSKLKRCVIMGGNIPANESTNSKPEFNFKSDPEAVHAVLGSLNCKIELVTYDLAISCSFTWDWYERFVGVDTRIDQFFKKIEEKTIRTYYKNPDGTYKEGSAYVTCDQIAAAVVVNESIVRMSRVMKCDVELIDPSMRGLVKKCDTELGRNVEIITEINQDEYEKLLVAIMYD